MNLLSELLPLDFDKDFIRHICDFRRNFEKWTNRGKLGLTFNIQMKKLFEELDAKIAAALPGMDVFIEYVERAKCK